MVGNALILPTLLDYSNERELNILLTRNFFVIDIGFESWFFRF